MHDVTASSRQMEGQQVLSYEAYLDEVCTLLFELFDLGEAQSVAMVMRAQDDGFFMPHDQDDTKRQLAHALGDADAIFMRYRGRL